MAVFMHRAIFLHEAGGHWGFVPSQGTRNRYSESYFTRHHSALVLCHMLEHLVNDVAQVAPLETQLVQAA